MNVNAQAFPFSPREHAHAQSTGQKPHARTLPPLPLFPCRENQLGVSGWNVVADALERVPSLTSLNDCTNYAKIRKGGLKNMFLEGSELGLWATRFFEKSAKTLTTLDIR